MTFTDEPACAGPISVITPPCTQDAVTPATDVTTVVGGSYDPASTWTATWKNGVCNVAFNMKCVPTTLGGDCTTTGAGVRIKDDGNLSQTLYNLQKSISSTVSPVLCKLNMADTLHRYNIKCRLESSHQYHGTNGIHVHRFLNSTHTVQVIYAANDGRETHTLSPSIEPSFNKLFHKIRVGHQGNAGNEKKSPTCDADHIRFRC